jgi:septum site-determining protein MinD
MFGEGLRRGRRFVCGINKIFKLVYVLFFMGKVIGVVSLKGGVGKTSSVAALGDSIAKFGKKVLLVDCNLSAPNLGLHFGIVDDDRHINAVLARRANIGEVIHNSGEFDIIPGALNYRYFTNPLSLKDKLKDVLKNYDYVILDSSPNLGDETLGAMLASDNILVVSTPDHPTLSTTINAVRLARQRGTPIAGILLNKVYGKDFELTLEQIEEHSGVPVMAVIPHDINFSRALADLKPYTSHKPNSGGSDEFRRLAAALIGMNYKPVNLKSLVRWISPRKQDINRTVFTESVY